MSLMIKIYAVNFFMKGETTIKTQSFQQAEAMHWMGYK